MQVSMILLGSSAGCPVQETFNIATTAGFYSTLAGVLAGFSFTAIVLITTTRLEHSAAARAVYAAAGRVLSASFLGLVVVSLAYASQAGEEVSSGLAAGEESILSLAFAASGILVVYAIVLMLDAVEATPNASRASRQVALFVRSTVARWATLLLMFFIYDSITDYDYIHYAGHHGVEPLDILSWVLIGAQFIVSTALYSVLIRPKWQWSTHISELSTRVLTVTMLSIIILSAAGYVILDAVDNNLCASVSPVIPILQVAVGFLAMASTTYQLGRTQPPKEGNTRQTERRSHPIRRYYVSNSAVRYARKSPRGRRPVAASRGAAARDAAAGQPED